MTKGSLASFALALALISVGAPVAAQEPDPSPSPQRPDLLEEMPRQMGGFEPDIFITRGQEHLAGLDLSDAADAATARELERLFEETEVSVEAMTSGYALVSQPDFFSFVVAMRLEGAIPGTVLPAYLPILEAGLTDPTTSMATIGGKDVLVIASEGSEGEFVELYVYDAGDTVWMLQGPDDVVRFALEDLR